MNELKYTYTFNVHTYCIVYISMQAIHMRNNKINYSRVRNYLYIYLVFIAPMIISHRIYK